MATQPRDGYRQPGHNGSTPQGPSYLSMPYAYWPKDRQPRVRCGGCDAAMEPTGNPDYPHEWRCPGECDGYIDLFPPPRVPLSYVTPAPHLPYRNDPPNSLPEKQCGVMVHSVRCGKPIRWGDMCCDPCAERIVTDMWERPRSAAGGMWRKREFILDLVGNLMMQRERAKRLTKEKNEKAAKAEAVRLARQDTSHHVVYFARLGQNHIKIGTTGDLPRRMAELRVVNANNLLAAEPGGPDVEKQRHQQFKKWRYSARKEDFGESRELHAHIAEVRAEHGDPYELAAALAQQAA